MKKDSLVIDGKTFISSRRASEIAAYSKDYVGQLCREGKLVCRQVNRLWWVDESSIRKHANETVKSNHTSFRSADAVVPPAVVVADIAKTGTRKLFLASSVFVTALVIVTVFASVSMRNGSWPMSAGSPFRQLAAAYAPAEPPQSFAGFLWSSFVSILPGHSQSTSGNIAAGNSSSNGSSTNGLSSAGSGAPTESAADLSKPHAGLVVVPSQGSSTDTKLAQAITNSFSDNVTVTPGADGTQGVIQPEFRTVAGHDFLYVLVPVKTASTPTQN